MEDYCHLLQDITHRLTSYSNKWKSKLKHQSSLSSYHTTKRAQLQTVRSPEKLARLIQTRYDAIQTVITTYKNQVERMYSSERFGTVHKHYRSSEMERLFKNAYSYLRRISDKLEKLREQEKKAQDALRDAKMQCQNLELNEMTSESKQTRANDHLEKKRSEIQTIKDKIARTEKEYNQEREIYRKKATEIYKQCRELEKERLDQIQNILIQFIEAIHSSEYSNEQDALYEDLLSNIKSQQDSLIDLDFWAHTYHGNVFTESRSSEINPSDTDDDENTESRTTTQKTKNSDLRETVNLTAIEENTNQSVAENQEEQPAADTTSTSAKAKPKKKKNSRAAPTTADSIYLSQE
jgi:hypothetical protein